MRVEEFLESPFRNQWLKEPGIQVYVRKPLPGKPYDIELATLNAKHPGKGACTRLLNRLEPKLSIYIENVLEPRFAAYFERRGYQRINNAYGGPPCYIRLKS